MLSVQFVILTLIPDVIEEIWPLLFVWGLGVGLPLASLIVMLNMPLRDPLLDSSGIGKPFTEPTASVRSPEDIITLWQWMTVSWMAPLIRIGYKRQLNNEDVWSLAYEFQHDRLHRLFREVPGTVLARLLKANGLDLVIICCLGICETCLDLASPVLLKQLLGSLTAAPPNYRAAIAYAGITLITRLIKTQSGVFSLWYSRRAYERCRGEMITMIHEKTLKRKAFTFPSGNTSVPSSAEEQQESHQEGISTATTLTDDESDSDNDGDNKSSGLSVVERLRLLLRRGYRKSIRSESNAETPTESASPASTGKILNLMRNDAYEVAQRFWEAAGLITKPLNFIISLVLIWNILGPASLSGILILVTGMAFNMGLMRMLLRIEQDRREVTDTKLQRTSQFVEAIRHLRWYAWQNAWLEKIMESRRDELSKRIKGNIVMKAISMVNSLAAYLFPVAGFWAFAIVSKKPLTVDVAFPALDLFSTLQDSLRELPDLITVLLNARVAMMRIEKFMLEPEKEDLEESGGEGEAGVCPLEELEVVLKDASFSWPGAAKRVLRNVSVTCRPGLTLVCGKVGIGKSALLQAVLGEMDQHGGERVVPREMIGYCAQSPWLESMSIRENILFSSIYDKTRFEQVLDACCLREDLDKFRCKDLTLIGENGVGLSGGQRARVALARAIYSRARILLLDDPIASLDHQTATRIMKNLFSDKNCPLTAGRLVIFVTHRIDIATPYANQVIEILDDGRIETFDRTELESNEEELQHLASLVRSATQATLSAHGSRSEEEEPVPDKFIEDEHRVNGGVLASVYWQYVKAGRLRWWAVVIFFFTLFRLVRLAYFWFLKEWGEKYDEETEARYRLTHLSFQGDLQRLNPDRHALQTASIPSAEKWLDFMPSPAADVKPWLLGFLLLSFGQVFTLALSDIALVVIVYQAGKNLFQRAMHRVANATFRFYDVTPVGRLMNRLTSDMGTVDGQIAGQLMSVAWFALGWLSSIAVIATTTPPFLLISMTMTALFILIFDRFLPTSQSLRRLETVSLSPLMSNFGTLVEGLTTVRAFHAEHHFQNRVVANTDTFQKMDHIYWCLQAWLQYRFDLLSALSTFALTLTAILSGLSSGTVGFVLASASNFVQATHSLCRRYGEMQMQFVSVERLIELLGLEQEPCGNIKPPASWPLYGDDIIFDKVTLRYAPELPPVLENVSFRIPGGANVAVTGRTGSGKSTLALSLLGILHPDHRGGGSIRIGGVDLANVDKQALRRNITFVAQDPVLFPGTLRDNLDPLGEHSDEECALVLNKVLNASGLASSNSDGSIERFSLDTRVDGGGKNLSQGQRQLVGLGRAMLRRSPIVIMDEATASIDGETAMYIHRLLREELKYSTVITIAHKAEAVADADFEIVLDRGRVIKACPRRTESQITSVA